MQPTFLDELLMQVCTNYSIPKITRIYVGSSFCSQYFQKLNLEDTFFAYCRRKKLSVTLTVPVFSQKDFVAGKSLIVSLCRRNSDLIDEVTVNDPGMLLFLQQNNIHQKLNVGRLFFKEPRDIRVRTYFSDVLSPEFPLICDANIGGAELDLNSQQLDLSKVASHMVTVAVHSPYCYMSVGNICKFASTSLPIEKKFRPNGPCQMDCSIIFERTIVNQNDCELQLVRIGRTIYYYNGNVVYNSVKPDREIYFPVNEVYRLLGKGVHHS